MITLNDVLKLTDGITEIVDICYRENENKYPTIFYGRVSHARNRAEYHGVEEKLSMDEILEIPVKGLSSYYDEEVKHSVLMIMLNW